MSDHTYDLSQPLERIAVVGGGGLMGHGIVLACLLGSTRARVQLIARRQETLEHGLQLLRSGPFGLEGAVRKGKLSAEDMEQMLARVQPTLSVAAGVADAQLIFETIPEEVAKKHAALREIEAAAPTDAIIASNTSSIMIAELSGVLERPARMLGTHWFYPSNIMPLIEVARADQTADWAVETTVSFLQSIRKKPVVVGDSPGFFMTRFINLYIAEAMQVVEQGICGIREVDEMVKSGLGWPMGVFELLDKTASFDSWYHAQEYLHETLGERYAIPPIARKVFAAGFRGASNLKPGSRGGWYDYFKIEPQGEKK